MYVFQYMYVYVFIYISVCYLIFLIRISISVYVLSRYFYCHIYIASFISFHLYVNIYICMYIYIFIYDVLLSVKYYSLGFSMLQYRLLQFTEQETKIGCTLRNGNYLNLLVTTKLSNSHWDKWQLLLAKPRHRSAKFAVSLFSAMEFHSQLQCLNSTNTGNKALPLFVLVLVSL